MLNKLKRLSWGRIRQAALHNPMERKYYRTAELRKMGFKSVGENVRVERSCVIVNPAYISIGHDVIIDQFTFIVAGRASVNIGSWIHIAGHNLLGGNAGLEIGDFANIAAGSKLISSSDDFGGQYLIGPAVPQEYTKLTSKPISVGKLSILGAGTIVLPGVTCAEGTATGANALLVKSTEPWGMYTGMPAKRARDREVGSMALAKELEEKFSRARI